MNKDHFEINGITPLRLYPCWIQASDSKQFYETDLVCIDYPKPPIECVMEASVQLSICSYKVICTPVGKKLLIQGKKHIKVVYVADTPCQSVHTAHFEIPFYSFVVLGCGNYNICDVFAAVEDIQMYMIDCKRLSISTLIFICPHYHEKCDCTHSECEQECVCECEWKYCKQPICYPECKTEHDYCKNSGNHVNLGYYGSRSWELCGKKHTYKYSKKLLE